MAGFQKENTMEYFPHELQYETVRDAMDDHWKNNENLARALRLCE